MVAPAPVQQQQAVPAHHYSKSNKTATVSVVEARQPSRADMPPRADMPTPAQAMGQPLINQTPHIATTYVSVLHKSVLKLPLNYIVDQCTLVVLVVVVKFWFSRFEQYLREVTLVCVLKVHLWRKKMFLCCLLCTIN